MEAGFRVRLCVRLCGSHSLCQSHWNSSVRHCTPRMFCGPVVRHFLRKVERGRGQDFAPHMNEKYFGGLPTSHCRGLFRRRGDCTSGSSPHIAEGFFGTGSYSHKNVEYVGGREAGSQPHNEMEFWPFPRRDVKLSVSVLAPSFINDTSTNADCDDVFVWVTRRSENCQCPQSMQTHNMLHFHHIPLHTVAALQGWEKASSAATVGNKDGSSLPPTKAPNPQEKDGPASLTSLAQQVREKDFRHYAPRTSHQKKCQRFQRWTCPRSRSRVRRRCANQGFSGSRTSTCLPRIRDKLPPDIEELPSTSSWRSIPLKARARARTSEPKRQNHHALVAASLPSHCSRHSNAFAEAAAGRFRLNSHKLKRIWSLS